MKAKTIDTSSYYPAGACYDSKAPWNEEEPKPIDREIEYSCGLRRVETVPVTDYVPTYVERGEYNLSEPADFADTDWLEEYKKGSYTALELIAILRKVAEEKAQGTRSAQWWRRIARACEGWEAVDEAAEPFDPIDTTAKLIF